MPTRGWSRRSGRRWRPAARPNVGDVDGRDVEVGVVAGSRTRGGLPRRWAWRMGCACFEWSALGGGEPGRRGDLVGRHAGAGAAGRRRTVRADLANMGVREFRRAYLNQWPDPADEGWRVFDEAHWLRATSGEGLTDDDWQ